MDFKALRAKRNDKARSLIESSGGKVDSSDWTPDEPLKADVKTGMRPISRRAFKTGGKVDGEEAKTNLSRAPRGNVGLANTNQRVANEERDGEKHVGGFARGGYSKSAVDKEISKDKSIGGKEAKAINALLKGRQKDDEPEALKRGGRTGKQDGGMMSSIRPKARPDSVTYRGIGTSEQDGMPEDDGSTVVRPKARPAGLSTSSAPTASARPKAMPAVNPDTGKLETPEETQRRLDMYSSHYKRGGKTEKFEGSAKDKAEDKKLAAKRGMSMKKWEASSADDKHDEQQSMKGLKHGGKADKDHDDDCSCKACGGRMGRATGGRAGKGKTNIVINVMPHTAGQKPTGIQPPMPMPPVGGPPPMGGGMPPPPMHIPPGLGAAMAGAAGAGPMPPAGPPPGAGPMPPMMARKSGGKVYPKMKFGAGSGEGRLEKIEKYGKNA